MLTISAALVVRNEEAFLAGCLESIRPLVDEVVVVDTGSTDATLRIARQHGARIFAFPWRGRFDEARNEALRRCRAPWILYIDADERARPMERSTLHKQLSDPALLACRVGFVPKAGLTPYREWRLFRNHPRIRFQGAIHETHLPALHQILESEGGRTGDCDLVIEHLGYEGDLTHKHHRNLPLLLRAVAEDPERHYLWSELGRTYQALGRSREADAAWRRGLGVARAAPPHPSHFLAYSDLIASMLDRGEDASALVEEALRRFPDNPEIRWLAGRQRMARGRWAEALPFFEGLLGARPVTADDPPAAFDEQLFGLFPCEAAATCHFRLGHWAESYRLFARAAAEAPDRFDLRMKAALTARRAGIAMGPAPSPAAAHGSAPPPAGPMRLLLRGPYRSPTGYGGHTRSLARALRRLGAGVGLVDEPSFSPFALGEEDLAEFRDLLHAQAVPGVALQVTLPTLAAPVEAPLRALYTMFEASRIPASWAAASRQHDVILVPTSSSLEAWREGGHPEGHLRLCPLGVDPHRFHPGVEPLPLADRRGRPVLAYRTRFLTVAEVMPRKNLPGLVRAWLRATRAEDDAVLIVKLGGLTAASAFTLLRAMDLVERRLGRRRAEAAPIVWVSAVLPEGDVPRLFATATHYVSLSFGEGWDHPMLQAGVMGRRLLAPAHSAYLSYLDGACARLVPARPASTSAEDDPALASIVEGAREVHSLFDGATWWRPDEEAAAAYIRQAIAAPDGPWPTAPERLRRLTWDASAQRVLDVLGELAGG